MSQEITQSNDNVRYSYGNTSIIRYFKYEQIYIQIHTNEKENNYWN